MFTTINRAIDASLAKRRDENEKGFTLIELMVVVIIIGILAAIAIPAFLNQRNSAWQAAAKTDLKNAQTSLETYATTNNGKFNGTPAWVAPVAADLSDSVTITVSAVSATAYSLKARNTNLPDTADTFTVTQSGKMNSAPTAD